MLVHPYLRHVEGEETLAQKYGGAGVHCLGSVEMPIGRAPGYTAKQGTRMNSTTVEFDGTHNDDAWVSPSFGDFDLDLVEQVAYSHRTVTRTGRSLRADIRDPGARADIYAPCSGLDGRVTGPPMAPLDVDGVTTVSVGMP